MTMSDNMQFLAHWTLIGVLMFFVIGTLACLMGLIVVPKRWKDCRFRFVGGCCAGYCCGAILG